MFKEREVSQGLQGQLLPNLFEWTKSRLWCAPCAGAGLVSCSCPTETGCSGHERVCKPSAATLSLHLLAAKILAMAMKCRSHQTILNPATEACAFTSVVLTICMDKTVTAAIHVCVFREATRCNANHEQIDTEILKSEN